jgi:TRAP-type uncharacterized transport system substrate-binding protein
MVDHKAPALHVQHLHAGTGAVDKYEHVAVLYVAPHQVGHHAAQGVKTAAHIGGQRIEVIPHRWGEAKHGA